MAGAFTSEMLATSNFVMGILTICLIPGILFGNFLVLISLRRFRFRFRTTTNLFIGSLSSADCMLATVTLPLYAAFYFKGEELSKYKYLCLIKYSSVICSMGASLLSLVAIAFDRYIAIIHPLRYPMVMTRRKAWIIIVANWIYHFGVLVTPVGWNNYDETTHECVFFTVLPLAFSISTAWVYIFLNLAICLFLYIRIFFVAKKHRKKIAERRAQHDRKAQKQFEKDTRSAKTMALVLFLFFAFWVPFLLTGPLRYSNLEENITELIKNVTLFVAMFNSLMNPIIYCWMRDDFRLAFKTILTCFPKNDFSNSKHEISSEAPNEEKSQQTIPTVSNGTPGTPPLHTNGVSHNNVLITVKN